ncbi:MAG: hypothetical protein U9Q85_02280 [Patescibacteria group bacterium]|nr:hypothetical protein [Patescibacteria group bacterium]
MFDLATKYCFYLDNDPKKSMRYFMLLLEIENYVNGAVIQMNRLERHRARLRIMLNDIRESKKVNQNKFRSTYFACDTHYYFICIDKIYKLLKNLHEELNDEKIKKLRARINKYFNISTVRNHLEHIEDRCVGFLSLNDKKNNNKKQINDFGSFLGDDYTFNNEKYPSSKISLKEIKDIYKELIKILHHDYALKNPEFTKRQEIEAEHEKIMKNLKKIGFIKKV